MRKLDGAVCEAGMGGGARSVLFQCERNCLGNASFFGKVPSRLESRVPGDGAGSIYACTGDDFLSEAF